MQFEDFDPEFPHWIHQVVHGGGGCPHCRSALSENDIVCIGAGADGHGPLNQRRAVGRVYMKCPQCRQDVAFGIDIKPADVLAGVHVFLDYIVNGDPAQDVDEDEAGGDSEDDDDTDLPSPNAPPPKPQPKPKSKRRPRPKFDGEYDFMEPERDERTPTEKRLEAMRRKRKAQLKRPPSDREVQAFLNKLKRTSFQRNTKSWQAFMRQLGIDPDQPDGGFTNVDR